MTRRCALSIPDSAGRCGVVATTGAPCAVMDSSSVELSLFGPEPRSKAAAVFHTWQPERNLWGVRSRKGLTSPGLEALQGGPGLASAAGASEAGQLAVRAGRLVLF